jgi:hypothetical protein
MKTIILNQLGDFALVQTEPPDREEKRAIRYRHNVVRVSMGLHGGAVMDYGDFTRKRGRYRPLFSFLAGVTLLALSIWIGNIIRNLMQFSDLGAKPPEISFQRVFYMPPPAGVRDLKVAGVAAMSGFAWMRFRVDDVDAVVKALPLSGPYKASEIGLPKSQDYDKDFERAVGWESVHHIKRPEYYGFPNGDGYSGWRGTLVVDRQRKLMFVRADLF